MHVICASSRRNTYYLVPIAPRWDTRYESISSIPPLSRSDESLSVRLRSSRTPTQRVFVSWGLCFEESNDGPLKSSLLWCAMLAAKVAFLVAVLFLVNHASEARYHSRLSRVLQSGDDRSSSRAKERREEQDWYFEQCRFVNAWKEHLGHVSVLAFLDPAWQYSFRQAVMLELLSSRLRKSGFPDIRFFVISPSFDSTKNDRSEENLEIEVWQEIAAKYEMENLVDNNFLRGNGSDIIFLQDDSQSRMWERFRASREQAIIIDRCGKLTYHVIVPWSILFFPYVKAAILSTYNEDPCGGCDAAVNRTQNHVDHVVELTKNATKHTEKEASPTHHETDTEIEAIWNSTESLENATLHHDESSSEEERETSTVSSTPLEEITNDTDRPNLSTESPTESTTYWYNNGATESQFNEDHSDVESTTWGQEDSTSLEGGTVSNGTATTVEPQWDVFPPKQEESYLSANNNSLTPANHEDTMNRILSLDESVTDVTENDSTYVDEETTTDFANKIQDNTTPQNAESFGEDAFLPLRIIMYAPHVHENGRKTKKYKHLVLKTGDPDFHGHLDSEVDVSSPTYSDVDSHVASTEEYDSETTEADADEWNVNQNYTFDTDESPGLYGEVADYWRSYEDNDITDRNETFNDTYNNSTASYNEEHRSNVSDHATIVLKPEESYSIADITEDPNVESFIGPQNVVGSNTIESSRPINENDQVDREDSDREIRYKFIEHYNKLLSWIDYRLNK